MAANTLKRMVYPTAKLTSTITTFQNVESVNSQSKETAFKRWEHFGVSSILCAKCVKPHFKTQTILNWVGNLSVHNIITNKQTGYAVDVAKAFRGDA